MAGPDYTSILTALMGADKAAEETNPWSGLEGFSNSFGTALTQASPQYDLQDNLIAGLLTGAVSGLSKNFSTSYKNEQRDYAAQAVKDLIEGKSLSKPDGISPSVFNSLRGSEQAMSLAKMQSDQNRQDELDAQIKLKQTPNASELRDRYSDEFLTSHGIPLDAPREQIGAMLSEERQRKILESKDKIPDKAISEIAHGTDLIEQVKTLTPLIDQMSWGNPVRIGKSYSLDTPEGMYENKLHVLSEELAKQFAGRTSWPSIQQQLKSLTVRQVGSKDALKEVVGNLQSLLTNQVEDRASGYGQKGYDLLERMNQGSGANNAPTVVNNSSIDKAALASEAAALKASGMAPAEVAATLRTKYQGK